MVNIRERNPKAPSEVSKADPSASLSVPAIIAAAGEDAVQHYRAFFHQESLRPSTRQLYGSIIRRFFRWAEKRGLALETICTSDASAFCDEVCCDSTANYLSAIRSLFRHFETTGVLVASFSETLGKRSAKDHQERKTRPRVSLAELKEMLLELDESWENEPELFQAGLVLLSPLSLGTTDPEAISRFSGVPLPLVQEFAGRLLANGCWTAGAKIAVSSFDPVEGGVCLILNVLVAVGLAECRFVEEGDTSQPTYQVAGSE